MKKTIFKIWFVFFVTLVATNTWAQQIITFTENPLATITLQPVNATTCEASNTTFVVNATIGVGALTYQWQYNSGSGWNNLSDAGVYSGATTNTLAITGATNGMNTYQYLCIITTTIGSCPINSNSATLTVNPLPVITVQPANTAVCESANTSIIITDNAATHQWQENQGSGWNNLANAGVYGGVTTTTLALTGVTAGMNTYQYRCVSTSAAGCSINSNAAILTVNPLPTITVQPANTAICESANTSIIITDNAATHQWQENQGSGWNNLANAGVYGGVTTTTLTLTGVTAGMNNYQYRCVSTSVAGCSINSNSATLTVNPIGVITAQPVNDTTCESSNASFTINANAVGGVTYQWQVNGGTGWTNLTDAGIYFGSQTNTLLLSGVVYSMNGYQYRCIVTTVIGGCPINTSVACLIINPSPITTYTIKVDGVTGLTGSYCQGASGNIASISGSQLNYTYQLEDANPPFTVRATVIGTGGAIAFPAQLAGSYRITVISTAGCSKVF